MSFRYKNIFFSYICTDLKIFLKDNLNSESEDIPQYVSPIFVFLRTVFHNILFEGYYLIDLSVIVIIITTPTPAIFIVDIHIVQYFFNRKFRANTS